LVFATESATVPAADPLLLGGVLFGQLGAAPEAKAFYQELLAAPGSARRGAGASSTLATSRRSSWRVARTGMRQYLGSALLQERVAALLATAQTVAAHLPGVPSSRGLTTPPRDGAPQRPQTTCLPKYLERTATF